MKRIGDVSRILSGGTPRKNIPENWGGSIPWFSAANMHEKYLERSDINLTEAGLDSGSRIAPEGSTLLLVRGSGLFNHIPICFAKSDVAFNQDVKAFVPDEHTDPLFFHYWLESMRSKLSENLGVTGIGAGKFDTDFLRNLPFPDLPRSKQEEIGRVAALCDDKIELNRRMAATLEEMARALYRSWFVDFDPVKAKAEGLAPAFMDETTAALFPDRFGDDGLPEGWGTISFVDVIAIISGGTPKTSEPSYWGGEIPWYSVVDAPGPGQIFVIDTEKTITEHGLKNSPARLVPRGTTIISARGTVGKLAMTSRQMTFNQSCYGLRSRRNRGDAFCYFATERAVGDLQSRSHGSVFSTITRQTFESVDVVDCSSAVLDAFADRVDGYLARICTLVEENRTLSALRDTLLPKLMSGELRVGEARDQIEEVA